ncbi:MAG: ATP-binding protein [Chloroflexota bacterium]
MITLSEFFEINHQLILFVYGLVFFVLGLAIILQTRRSSRLELARSLRWLAAFGITHGFHEWGDLFIPLQAEYLNAATMQMLFILHLLLLAISFVCLFEFGLAVLRPRGLRLHWISLALFGAWLVVSFGVLFPFMPDEHLWRHTANALARYFIGFPGGLLAAYGLRVHTLERIQPLNVPKIVQTFRVAGIAFGFYALFGGLVPPPVAFFPGNLLNTETFTGWIGAPPWVFRSAIAAVIAVTLIRALEIFDVETQRRIEELEQQQILNAERERLARELHDGAIQKVYTAGLLVESASRLAERESEVGARLQQAVVVLNDSIADLRRNLAELHGQTAIQTEPLPQLLAGLAQNPHYNSLVNVSLALELTESKALSPARSSHVLAIANEALSNTVRHAHAQNVWIEARDLGERLKVVIRDDGIGIPPNAKNGYGLRNMRDRARLLNGTIDFVRDGGTLVTLDVPWED